MSQGSSICGVFASVLLAMALMLVVAVDPALASSPPDKLFDRMAIEAQHFKSPYTINPLYARVVGQYNKRRRQRQMIFYLHKCDQRPGGRQDWFKLKVTQRSSVVHLCHYARNHWTRSASGPPPRGVFDASWQRIQGTVLALAGCIKNGTVYRTGCPQYRGRKMSTAFNLSTSKAVLDWLRCYLCANSNYRKLTVTFPGPPVASISVEALLWNGLDEDWYFR